MLLHYDISSKWFIETSLYQNSDNLDSSGFYNHQLLRISPFLHQVLC